MRTRIIAVAFIVILILALVGCSSSTAEMTGDNLAEQDVGEQSGIIILNSTNRKIVYTVEAWLTTEDFDTTIEKINAALNEVPEDKNSVASSSLEQQDGYRYAYFSVKVKTTALETFLTKLAAAGTQTSRTVTSQDITNAYAKAQARIAALQEEKLLYNGLIADETVPAAKAVYITRVTEINAELALLTETLSEFDSDVEYSTVNITIRSLGSDAPEPSFGQRIKNAFVGTFSFLWKALKWIFIAFIYVLPFGIIAVGITLGVLFFKKKRKQKQSYKNKVASESKSETDESGKQ